MTEQIVVPEPAGRAELIETRSIDHVPIDERRGQAWQQGPFWFMGNFNFFTVALGFVGPSLGLDFFWTAAASLSGILFGTIFVALHALQGPKLGLPQMVQSRAQFGYRGVIVPLVGTLATFVGFNVVDTIILREGLSSIYGLPQTSVAICVSLVAVIVAVMGHDYLHVLFRLLFWVSLPVYLWLTFGVATADVGAIAPSMGFSWVAVAAQFAATASYNITFGPYVSDYTRYLPPDRAGATLLLSVYLGSSLSALWLVLLGALLATRYGAVDAMQSLLSAGNSLFPSLGTFALVVSVMSLILAMALNAYSGMLTVITGLHSLTNIPLGRHLRVVCVLGLAVVWMTIAGITGGESVSSLYLGLTIMLYLLLPWTAINLIDYFLIRRGRYSIPDLFDPRGAYGTWNKVGLLSYGTGFVAGVPFFFLAGLFEGPMARALSGVDIAWLVELVVSSAAYLVLARRDA